MKNGPRILFTEVSANSKTGPMSVAGVESSTCPKACPLIGKCYPRFGPISWHWKRLDEGEYKGRPVGIDWDQFLNRIRAMWKGQPWRMGTFGDLPGKSNQIDTAALSDLVAANKGKKGFGFTHKPVLTSQDKVNAPINRKAIKAANAGGFTINLSANNLEHADKLKALGIAPVATIVPSDSPKTFKTAAGNRVVVCPAQYEGSKITCLRCGFCQRKDREAIIGFWPHSSGAKYANAVATA